ncbi:phosphotransferase [Vibrio palustris]|uniref:Thiamine kinase n=1 Tax=Vibrio palustris TaxID=1918946 RepID=A0A1R4B1V8_9VIBR|nr:phosphotransferase [Vibrio palustris]SJL82867.1 thiamine kinase [Vibrio palustris]
MAKIAWTDACQLDESLRSLEQFFNAAPEYAQTLAGGLTNRCWKIDMPGQGSFVWRPISSLTQAFAISRFQEYQILKALEPEPFVPQAAYLNNQGLLVEWLDGELVSEDENIATVLKCMVNIHHVDPQRVPVAPFHYTARIDHYWRQLSADLKDDALLKLYTQWRDVPILPHVDLTLCHFDLGFYNLIKQNEGIVVIDWEYACIADPRLDLALMIGMADVNLPTTVAHYCQLRNIIDVDSWINSVKIWQPRTQLLALLWYLLAFQIRGDVHYKQQAQQLKARLCC